MKNLTCTLIAMLAILKLAAKELVTPNEAKQLLFIENKGQITDQYKQERKDIDFKLDGGGMSIFVGDGQIHYQWYQYTGKPGDSAMEVNTYRMDVQLVGANPNAPLQKEEVDKYYENYYTPQLKDGVTAKSYRRMVYKNIYPQIDWVIYTKGQELKYDFVVHKGGNPADIRLQYNGATGTELKGGVFTASTPMGSITEEAPYSYEIVTQKEVASAYKLQNGVLSFEISMAENDIIIDPVLVWTTMYGGSNNDVKSDVAADDTTVFITGETSSATNVVSIGAYSAVLNGSSDFLLVKFDTACNRRWATYFGGSWSDGAESITMDRLTGDVYIQGRVYSDSMATPGAFIQYYNKSVVTQHNALLAKFNKNGIRIWATYLSATPEAYDYGADIICDRVGNIYFAGVQLHTGNVVNESTPGAYKTTRQAYVNGSITSYASSLILKFNSSGNRIWGTYFPAEIRGLGLDTADDLLVVGNTRSYYDSIATTGSHQTIRNSAEDGLLARVSKNGNSLLMATYYGGGSGDTLYGATADRWNNIYVVGISASATGIATSGAFQTGIVSGSSTLDAVLARFTPYGARLWGTYYGANTKDCLTGVIVNSKNTGVFVYGYGGATSLSTPGALSVPTLGGYMLANFDSSGGRVWSAQLGGTGNIISYLNRRMAMTDRHLYVSGNLTSVSTAYGNAYQNYIGGSSDMFLMQIRLDTMASILVPFADTVLCPGDSFKVKIKCNFPFRSGNVYSVLLSNATGSFALSTVIGTKTANGYDSVVCVVPKTMLPGNGYRIKIAASAPTDTSDDNGKNIRIKPLPIGVVASSNAPICATDTLRLSGSSGNTDVTYSWAGVAGFASGVKDTFRAAATTAHTGNYILTVNRQGCIVKDTTYVLVKPRPDTPDASSNSPLCTGATINLTGNNITSGVSYVWNGPASFSSTLQSPTRTGAITSHSGIYRVYTSLNGCTSLMYDSTSVTVYPVTASPLPSANTPLCLGQDLQLGAGTIPGASYVWSGPSGYSSTLQNPLRPASTSTFAGRYYVQAIVNGCISVADSVTVTVNAAPSINMYPSPKDSICVGQNVTFVSNTSNAGSSYTRSWFKNNNVIGGAANANYSTTTAADGDEYYVTLTAYGVCATPYTDTSNAIKMRVLPYLAPSVSISANPNTTVTSGTMINFMATPTNGGNTPKYQWTRNGTNITGAISNIWGASTLSNNDQICVDMTSGYLCPNPKTAKSNCIKVSIESTGIVGVWTGKEPSIYPNPTNDKLTIEGIDKGTKIQLSDVLGRVVIKATATSETTELTMSHLAAGSYMLTLSKDNGDRMSVKVVKE
jgi:hypothetical protein